MGMAGETGREPGQPTPIHRSPPGLRRQPGCQPRRPGGREDEPGVRGLILGLDEAGIRVHLHLLGVHTMVCVFFALLTAASNACAAVLQRRAAAQVPTERSMHLSLIADLIKRRVWLAGIGMVIVAAVAQAAALATGPIALVQPIFIIELPVTLVLAALANHNRAVL